MIKRLFWKCLDPIVRQLQSRMDHLKVTQNDLIDNSSFDTRANLSPDCKLTQTARLSNHWSKSQLEVSDYTFIRGELSVLSEKAYIKVGRYCYIGQDSKIWAQCGIEIGDHVLISHQVDIHDTNAHSINASHRREDAKNLFKLDLPMNWDFVEAKKVVIEDDVWVGFKSSILKGVTVGKGAIVAAGSVVTKDVPPYTLVAGNPAKIIRYLNETSE